MQEPQNFWSSVLGLNQLTTAKKMRWIPECAGSAPCYEWTNSYEGWSGSYSYDLNGNIQTLNRAGTLYYNDDQLSYTYQGNQIQSIADNASSTYKANGFVDGATAAQEYYYDANGNMHKDLNKGIEHIRYNRMNLPEMIVFSSGHEIHYLYDAAGTKLSKTTYPAGGGETTTDYSGGFVYTNELLDFFAFSQGRVRKDGSNWQYEYDLKDHLGNVRATFTENDAEADLLQADSYYPFGMKMPGLSFVATGADENKFTYNGKELEDEFGLDWYHYGARFYDPAVGRWWVTDPKDIEHSPYNYSLNDPIRFIDPDGGSPDDVIIRDSNGLIIHTIKSKTLKGDITLTNVNRGAMPLQSGFETIPRPVPLLDELVSSTSSSVGNGDATVVSLGFDLALGIGLGKSGELVIPHDSEKNNSIFLLNTSSVGAGLDAGIAFTIGTLHKNSFDQNINLDMLQGYSQTTTISKTPGVGTITVADSYSIRASGVGLGTSALAPIGVSHFWNNSRGIEVLFDNNSIISLPGVSGSITNTITNTKIEFNDE